MKQSKAKYLVYMLASALLTVNLSSVLAEELPTPHQQKMDKQMAAMNHASHRNGSGLSSDEHAAHRAAMEKKHYSISKEQYRVPAVTLIDRTGHSIELQKLLQSGQPLALNFIFTTCTTICPVMTATFAKMRQALGQEGEQLRMVSISIDPEYDRPEVLKKYAEKFHANARWRFLTGNGEDIHQVLQAFKNQFGSKMNHQPVTLLKKPEDPLWIRIDGLAQGGDLAREVRNRLFN